MTKPLEVVEIDRTSLDILVKGREEAGKPELTVYVDGMTKLIIDFTLTFPEQTGMVEAGRPT
ncbi:hypothetical protein DOZ80_15355 [Pseudomonas fluorescens]|uniref:Uncharacterized protein n=1 Tax=Pseudomonas fluorescens TaxID=294 RepID=A0A327N344_PSEFL|nr:hypothetical protein [Pseudomonas fluorescens]RAI69511.1 hypothetical protein DOZ80_15355 [Pseudomonas fluorescens]